MLDRFAPVIFVLLWSSGWIVAKYAAFHADALFFLFIRFGLSVVAFGVFCAATGARFPREPRLVLHAVLSGVFLHGLYLGPLWWAIEMGVPAGLSGIIAGLQPLLTAIAAAMLLGERLAPIQRLGLLLGFIGIGIAISPKLATFSMDMLHEQALPLVVNLLGMVSVTAGTLYQKRHLQSGDIRWIATLQYVGATLVLLPASLVIGTWHYDFSLTANLSLAWSVLGLSMGAIGLLLRLIRQGQVSRAASLVYLMPPLVALEAALFFGEPLTPAIVAGALIVVMGVYLTNRKGRESR
ncbi:DMT family transporter [Gellertiella hungarica]|uniref:Drug/metabolite transporter (DMT)-like permease n=1 Tax=Gellertiella hungarica TaxID=1572859 RepID=A0A7W6J1X9_9HYPH|nr:DMT family transporter [Gellertiella hungarica]MBB4063289.1 drug/metabolite transporter (DMT)-like permease [Gellertiella hungarica]